MKRLGRRQESRNKAMLSCKKTLELSENKKAPGKRNSRELFLLFIMY